ncbi:glutamine amidotransferase-like class 1 domain-containing protein 3, mitochondrial [Corticium candelabrum]|uniref:glutamine amidotransferase-like class 1 domain-containing protein 3, mitochondrial n=1 Tax=Corticium candelabrum TaxID=121492 RepID=UPI002E25BE14|nr:glutamine amidotransferase-like class 1 domain-containing protein 3, mitochondrial [Corticium candelabrum]
MASLGRMSCFLFRSARQVSPRKLLSSTARVESNKVAMVLSGCGVYDGSEIVEASACWIHLSRANCDVNFFAPDVDQMHVVDHVTGQPVEGEQRNVVSESGRIARGVVHPLSQIDDSSYDALVFPGGFGAAKNLSSFAVDGDQMNVNADVERAIKMYHDARKPIGLCCISPVLVAKVLPGCSVTVGHNTEEDGKWPYASTAEAIDKMGSQHVVKDLNEAHIDEKNLIVTSPAFMCNAKPHEIYESVGAMITALMALIKK